MFQQKPEIQPIYRKPWLKRLLKGIGIFLVLLCLLFFALVCVIQTRPVQNWLVNEATTYLSDQLQTPVTIEKIGIDFFDQLDLKNFYIEDFHGDTLLHSAALKVNLNTNLARIFQKDIAITSITLVRPQFRLTRYEGEKEDQFQQLLNKLGTNTRTTSSNAKSDTPWMLDVEAIYLDKAVFIKEDSVGGEIIEVFLENGNIQVEELDLVEKMVTVKTVSLSKPYVNLINFVKNELPVDTTNREVSAPSVDSLRKKWKIQAADFQLFDGAFEHHNYRKAPVKTSPDTEIDFNHLLVEEIQIQFTDFSISDWVFQGASKQFSLKESTGFVIENITAEHGMITPQKVALQGVELRTPYSQLKDSLVFRFNEYPDFKDFPNKVKIEGHFDRSAVALRDIMHFAPALKRNPFFAKNSQEILYIDGLLYGTVNDLEGKRLALNLGNAVRLTGDFDATNLTNPKQTILHMNLNRLQTNMFTLRSLVPNSTLPDNFNKLGDIDFNGDFLGSFLEFKAQGNLKTDLGNAAMNLNVDLTDGRDLATYRGQLDLINFDLAKWAGNDDFGIVSMVSTVEDGKGLTLAAAFAKLKTNIEQFHFRGYTYENITMNGDLNQNNFEGKLSIEDENIALTFDGAISDLEGEVPKYVFNASVKTLDAKRLNLLPQDFVFSGDLDITLRGKTLNELQGRALFKDIQIIKDSLEVYDIDSLEAFYATQALTRHKSWTIHSEILEGNIAGDFDINKVQEAVLQFFEKNYPLTAERFNIKSKGDTSFYNNQFDLELTIHDTKNLTHLLDKTLDTIKNTQLAVSFDYLSDSFMVDLNLPQLKYNNFEFDSITLKSNGLRNKSNIDFKVANSNLNDQLELAPLTLFSWIENDSMSFALNTKDLESASDRLNLRGEFSLIGELFNFRFEKDSLVILDDEWSIADDNFLQIGPNFIKTNNFELSRGKQKVALKTIEDKGIVLDVEGFNTSYINEIWSYKNLQFEGLYNIQARVKDLFDFKGLEVNAKVDSFYINGDFYGLFKLDAVADNVKSPVNFKLSTTNGRQTMETLKGIYNPPSIQPLSTSLEHQPNYLDVQFNIQNYPLKIAEYFVANGITNTKGDIESDLSFTGLLPKPDIDGKIIVSNGQTTIDYTGTTYFIDNDTALMNNKYLLDATGGTLTDSQGNEATVAGGITHDFFKDLGVHVSVTSDKFLIINTQKEDNDVYYGTGVGGGIITFSGDFDQTNIDIKATTKEGTEIFIPATSDNTVEETSFIRFEADKDTVVVDSLLQSPAEIRGIKLDIELGMTNEAQVQLIFDEQAGDIMAGSGFGNIKFKMTREGEISMYGDYEIDQGSYLFTAFSLVNKKFAVKRGGTIKWTGDPYNALIDIDAEYADLYTTPYNFIVEYLQDDLIKEEAKQSTLVNLTMKLSDRLFQPVIAFDVNFPNLLGELKNFTDSKLRTLRLDQNELNRQVFGLVVIGDFLPSNQGGLQGRELLTGINTLSELLSNQLSIYLTEFISKAFSNNFVSIEDFDIGYNVYEASFFDNPGTLGTGHEVRLRQRFRIRDRLVVRVNSFWDVNLGDNYITSSDEALVTGDFIVEYELSKDRRLKIRGYYKNEPELFGGRRNNAGMGLSFRREFDRLGLLDFLKKNNEPLLSTAEQTVNKTIDPKKINSKTKEN